MNKKCLVLNMDYIMYPCIKLYLPYIKLKSSYDNKSEYTSWNYLENQLNINDFIYYDANSLMQIANSYIESINNKSKIYNVDMNTNIIDILKEEICNEETNFDITNVSFFSGCTDNHEELAAIVDYDLYCNSNWVTFFMQKQKLNSFTWVKPPNTKEDFNTENYNISILSMRDFQELENHYDYVFFVKSSHYVPYKYEHLYNLISLCQKTKGE